MPDINDFPRYFREYIWGGLKHRLYGYPEDSYPKYTWISSLEKRFRWMCDNNNQNEPSSIYLLMEMIQWGGSQNGALQKFMDRLGTVNLDEIITTTINNIHNNNDNEAIRSALSIPGMGLTYASKLLRFMKPERYGALDSNIREALIERAPEYQMPTIRDGNTNSMVAGYLRFIEIIRTIAADIEKSPQRDRLMRPKCSLSNLEGNAWRAADIEMALFQWANEEE